MKAIKILLACSAFSFINVAQAANTFTLAEAKIKNSDMVSIQFDKCERIKDVRIKTDKDIWLSKIVATFDSSKSANDRTYNVQTNVEKDGKSKWISLGEKKTCVSSLTIYANPAKGSANIEILGRK